MEWSRPSIKNITRRHQKITAAITAVSLSLLVAADHDAPNCTGHAFFDSGRILIASKFETMARSVHSDATLRFPFMSSTPRQPDFYMHSFYGGYDPLGRYYPLYPAYDMNHILSRHPEIWHLDEVLIGGGVYTCNYPRGTMYVEADSIERIEIKYEKPVETP